MPDEDSRKVESLKVEKIKSKNKHMQSIKRRFDEIRQKNTLWSDHTCFADAIKETGFKRRNIVKWLNKSVDPGDYAKGDKFEVVACLVKIASRKNKNTLQQVSVGA